MGGICALQRASSGSSASPAEFGIAPVPAGSIELSDLTLALQRLTERALIEGLREPDKRPSAREWEEPLALAVDELWGCERCGQHFPYPYWLHPPQRRTCPFCGEGCRPPFPVVLELYEERQRSQFFPIDRRIVLGHGFRLFADMLEPHRKPPFTRRGERVVGRVEWDRRRGQYRLVNTEGGEWTTRSPDRNERFTARNGESPPLVPGYWIHFGEGKRLAVVREERGSP